MVELELLYHEQILSDCVFLLLRSCIPLLFDKRVQSPFHLTSLLLPRGRVIAGYKLINGQGREGNLVLRENVEHIEL